MRFRAIGLLFSTALALQACSGAPFVYFPSNDVSMPLGDSLPITDQGVGSGTLRLTLDLSNLSLLTQQGDPFTAPLADLTVTISHDGMIVDQQSLTATALAHSRYQLTFDAVDAGALDVQVKAYDTLGLVMARGTATVVVQASARVSSTVVLHPAGVTSPVGVLPVATPTPAPLPTATPRPTPTLAPLSTLVLAQPNQCFISQMLDATWNPTAPAWTLNCGPASLAMALKADKLLPPGLSTFGDPQQLIKSTRQAMMGTSDDFKLSSLEDLEHGAEACGLRHERAWGLDGVRSALAANKLVIVAGNPVAYNTRYTATQYSPFDGGHFVLVTGIDGSYVYVNDPLSRQGNLAVSVVEFQRYMDYNSWDVGVAVYRAAY